MVLLEYPMISCLVTSYCSRLPALLWVLWHICQTCVPALGSPGQLKGLCMCLSRTPNWPSTLLASCVPFAANNAVGTWCWFRWLYSDVHRVTAPLGKELEFSWRLWTLSCISRWELMSDLPGSPIWRWVPHLSHKPLSALEGLDSPQAAALFKQLAPVQASRCGYLYLNPLI